MATTPDMTRLLHLLEMKLPGASKAGIKAELYETVSEFFRDSSSWVEKIQVNVVAGTTEYELTPSVGQVIRLWGVVDANNLPIADVMPTVGTLRLGYTPNQNATFFAYAVLNVTLPTDSDKLPVLPDWLLQLYTHVILDGTLGRMYGQPQKTYTNDQLMAYHLRRFRDGVAMARVATIRANTVGTQNWQYPRQFKTQSQRGAVSVGNTQGF